MRVNVGYWVSKNGRLYADKEALVCAGRTVTYRELDSRVNQVAAGLGRMGLARGDRVAALLLNSVEYIDLFFACAKRGYVLVPLNFRLSVPELAFILSDCTPTALLYDPMFAGAMSALRQPGSPVKHWVATPVSGGGEYDERLLAQGPAPEMLDETVGGDDLLLIMYTAGTTGRAKGVMLTHDNCFCQSVNGWALGVSPAVVALVVLPLFHVGGLNGSVTPMLHVGATVVVPPRFDPAEALATIEKRRVNGVMAVPTVYQVLLEHPDFRKRDLSSLAVLISGGAPLPHALIDAYHKLGFEMRQGYGLTEASPGVTGMGPGDCLKKPRSVGKPCLYTEVRVVDDEGRDVPAGTVGEVIVKGPNVMKGYWNLPDETAAVLRDGWLHTGDLGAMDEDGYLEIVGRKKEMIISGGENIYPAEVEQVLAAHPAVAMAAVVRRPDPRWGEVPVAFVVLQPGRETTAREIEAFALARLARYKTPREYHFRPALPLSAAGKVLKRQLEQELAG